MYLSLFWYILYTYKPFTLTARQSISLTKPIDQWLKSLVENEEYSSKSEIVNDLIRKERDRQNELQWLRAKLKKSEERLAVEEPVTQKPEELLAEIKKAANDNG